MGAQGPIIPSGVALVGDRLLCQRERETVIRPEQMGLSSERPARIRPVIEKHVADDRIAGVLILIARRGELVHLECAGLMDREDSKPMRADTIFRLFSMTKPIVSAALMMLHEEGRFQRFHPVSRFIPAFRDLKVHAGKGRSGVELADLDERSRFETC